MRAVLLSLALALGACHPPAPPVTRVPAGASLLDASGARFEVLAKYRGQPVVLDFWASWCKECKTSVPTVSRLADAFTPQGVVVLGVNVGDDAATAARSAAELGIRYPIALDPELEFATRMGASQLPLVVVVGRDGTIVHRARAVDEATLAAVRAQLAAP
ncbi:MAG: TlpA family protein disulfide reductase [Deltaproteobacteria bacterium]|nr:TlpA family protein disulfide reductase [Deltaproteobacteria bacterium]